MTEIPITWKIGVTLVFLLMFVVCVFLTWHVLELMKRIKQIQDDRNKLIEERNKLKLKELDTENNLSEIEKKMILNALKMPEYGKAIQDPKTNFQVRKVYKELIKKIKVSFGD